MIRVDQLDFISVLLLSGFESMIDDKTVCGNKVKMYHICANANVHEGFGDKHKQCSMFY